MLQRASMTASLFGGYYPVSSENFRPGNPTLLTAWSVEAFCPRETFEEEVETLCDRIKKSRVADGFDEILLPGEAENRSRREKGENGIEIPDSVWNAILKSAGDLGLEPNL